MEVSRTGVNVAEGKRKVGSANERTYEGEKVEAKEEIFGKMCGRRTTLIGVHLEFVLLCCVVFVLL